MRMWLVPVKAMCRQHLLGEHLEMHTFVGTIRLGRSIKGYVGKGLVEPARLRERHDALADEMVRRGYLHRSPLLRPFYSGPAGSIDREATWAELRRRCPECNAIAAAYLANLAHDQALAFEQEGG